METPLNLDNFAVALSQNAGFCRPHKHSQTPITTGTSVVALAFDGGVIMAADMLGSYGSMARYRHCPRVMKVNDNTVVGCMGDYADFQFLKDIIAQKAIDEDCLDDGFNISPRSLHSWLTRVLYNKRSNFDPLWCTMVVGGLEDDLEHPGTKKEFLGFVDKIGCAYTDPIIATGFGAHLATPLMRSAVDAKAKAGQKLSEKDARDILTESLKVLFYRDARAFKRYQIAVVTKTGASIEGPFEVDSDWSIASQIKGYE